MDPLQGLRPFAVAVLRALPLIHPAHGSFYGEPVKALLTTGPQGPGLTFGDTTEPTPASNEALIALTATSLNRGEVRHLADEEPGTRARVGRRRHRDRTGGRRQRANHRRPSRRHRRRRWLGRTRRTRHSRTRGHPR